MKGRMKESTRLEREKRTRDKKEYILELGYEYIEMWECDYRKKRASINNINQYSLLPLFYRSHPHELTFGQIINAIRTDALFGMVEVDIHVPEKWTPFFKDELSPYEYYREMSPLFCTSKIKYDDIGEHMKTFAERNNISFKHKRLLVGGLKARKILLATPLLKWYINHGLEISRIYQIVEFTPKPCFKSFEEEVTTARRLGDVEKSKVVIGSTMKLIGNSAYGSMILCKEKHCDISYEKDMKKAAKDIHECERKKGMGAGESTQKLRF